MKLSKESAAWLAANLTNPGANITFYRKRNKYLLLLLYEETVLLPSLLN